MEEQFKYGELVEVRNHESDKWEERCYIATAPKGPHRYIAVLPQVMQEGEFNKSGAYVYPFAQIRKIQKPEPANNSESIEDFVKRVKTEIINSKETLAKIEDGTMQILYVKFIEKLVNDLKSINASSDGRTI